MAEERPVLLSKRKNIQVLLDYCLDQKLSFSVSPRAISLDDYEVEVNIGAIKQAIALGMFAKENKIEVAGMGELIKPKTTTATKKAEPKESVVNSILESTEPIKEEGSLLSFDLNVNGN